MKVLLPPVPATLATPPWGSSHVRKSDLRNWGQPLLYELNPLRPTVEN